MKDQFQSTEALKVRFPPFVNKSTGEEILGSDTCTVTYKKPDNSTGSLSATWDTDIQLWKLDIAEPRCDSHLSCVGSRDRRPKENRVRGGCASALPRLSGRRCHIRDRVPFLQGSGTMP